MSQFAAELCNLLITDNFGELYSLIFSYLLHYGRQPLPKIALNTHLSPQQVKHGIAVLIQQHLLFHITSLDDGITYYDTDWRGAYALVRSGKVIQVVEERLGEYAAQVMSVILNVGQVKISDLETMPEVLPQTSRAGENKANGLNGIHETEERDGAWANVENAAYRKPNDLADTNGDHDDVVPHQLHPTLRQLAAYGYIMRVRDAHFRSPSDNYQIALHNAERSQEVQGLKGKQRQTTIEDLTETQIKEWNDGTIRGVSHSNAPRVLKRRRGAPQSTEPARKRVKLENDAGLGVGSEDGESDDDYDADDIAPMDGELVICVNYQKFDVSFRNRRLIDLAEQHTTAVTSQVYETLLARIESKTPSCRTKEEGVPEGEENERYSVAIPLHTISSDLGEDFDLGGAIAGVGGGPENSLVNGIKKYDDELDDEEDEEDDEDGEDGPLTQNRIYQLQQHLSLLAQEPHFFATRIMESGMITWAVEFRHLAKKLRHLELERLIEARFGGFAVRIVRILSVKGRLDEKRLQELSLMASKDLRQILAQMEAAGFIELQEIPRDAQRQPSRTLYLWFYDPDRACTMVVEDIYKAMSRCLQRLKIERAKLKYLLEKAERTDVKANMKRYLSVPELKTLDEWHDKEALLLGEVGRLDDMVAVLRDF